MFTRANDTNQEAEKIQIDLIKRASVSQRIHTMSTLSSTTRGLSRRAIRRANPDFSEQDIDIAFVDLHYGHELAVRLKSYIASKK